MGPSAQVVQSLHLSVGRAGETVVCGTCRHLKTSRRIIGNLRATVMEGIFGNQKHHSSTTLEPCSRGCISGVFGNQKQHYAVGCIKARNMFSETLLLFFGIHTANAAILAARQMAAEIKKAA